MLGGIHPQRLGSTAQTLLLSPPRARRFPHDEALIMTRFRVFPLLGLCLLASPLGAQTLFSGAGGSGGEPGIERQCGPTGDGKTHLGGALHDLLTTEPLPGIAVAMREDGSVAGERITVTDDRGEFVVCELAWNGLTRIEVLGEDGESDLTQVELTPGANWVGTRFLSVVRAASLGGRVSDLSGRPVEGAVVAIEPLGLRTKTDADGAFGVHGLAGAVTLSVSHPSFETRTHDMWLDGGFGFEAQVPLGTPGAAVPAIVVAGGPEQQSKKLTQRPVSPLTGVTGADSKRDDPTDGSRWDRLQVGSSIRLTAPGVLVEDGLLTALEPHSVLVAEGDQEWSLPTQSLESLEVKESSSLRLGLILGVLGFGAGAALGAKFVTASDPCTTTPVIIRGEVTGFTTTCTRSPVGALAVGVPMALAGAGAGLVLGRIVLRWQPVF